MPGVLICEALAQAGGLLVHGSFHGGFAIEQLEAERVFLRLDGPRPRQVPPPGDPGRPAARWRSTLARRHRPLWRMRGVATVDGQVVAQADFSAVEVSEDGSGSRPESRPAAAVRVHPTAVVARGAELDTGVEIGPYAVVGPHVRIGDATPGRPARRASTATRRSGPDNRIFQFASVGAEPQDLKYRGEDSRLVIGDRNLIREFATLQPRHRGRRHGDAGRQRQPADELRHVGHDCRLGNRNILANGVALAGHVTSRTTSSSSGSPAVHQFVRVGESALRRRRLDGVAGRAAVLQRHRRPRAAAAASTSSASSAAASTAEQVRELKRAYRLLFQSKLLARDAVARIRAELAGSPLALALADFIAAASAASRGPEVASAGSARHDGWHAAHRTDRRQRRLSAALRRARRARGRRRGRRGRARRRDRPPRSGRGRAAAPGSGSASSARSSARFKQAGVRRAVMAGGIRKARLFSDFRPDVRGAAFLARMTQLERRRAAARRRRRARARRHPRGRVDRVFLGWCSAPGGPLSRRAPRAREWDDVRFGLGVAKAIGRFDIGQSVVVKTAHRARRRGARGHRRGDPPRRRARRAAARSSVKVSKPGQDLRFDVPAVGPETIAVMARGRRARARARGRQDALLERDKTLGLRRPRASRWSRSRRRGDADPAARPTIRPRGGADERAAARRGRRRRLPRRLPRREVRQRCRRASWSRVVDVDRGARRGDRGARSARARSPTSATLVGAIDCASVAVPTPAPPRVATALLAARHRRAWSRSRSPRAPARARALVALAAAHGRILQVGHLERFNPAHPRARRACSPEPRFIECHRLAPFTERGTDVDVILDLMIHDLDVILSARPTRRSSASRRSACRCCRRRVDIANARLRFASGCIANVTASRVSMKRERKIRFFQPDAYVAVDYGERRVRICRRTPDADGGLAEHRRRGADRLRRRPIRCLDEIEAFVASVRTRARPAGRRRGRLCARSSSPSASASRARDWRRRDAARGAARRPAGRRRGVGRPARRRAGARAARARARRRRRRHRRRRSCARPACDVLVDTARRCRPWASSRPSARSAACVRAYRRVRARSSTRRAGPDLVVLIDYPEFNLRARAAAQAGAASRSSTTSSPQVWAWRRGRVRKIAGASTRSRSCSRSRPTLYNAARTASPSSSAIRCSTSCAPTRAAAETRAGHGLDPDRPLVALLPGSRSKEMRELLPRDGARRRGAARRAAGRRSLALADDVDRGRPARAASWRPPRDAGRRAATPTTWSPRPTRRSSPPAPRPSRPRCSAPDGDRVPRCRRSPTGSRARLVSRALHRHAEHHPGSAPCSPSSSRTT